jgi:purine catabolism regulator
MVSLAKVSGREPQELITTAGADTLFDRLARMMVAGDDLGAVTRQIAEALDVGILVTSTDGRERAGAMSGDQRAVLTGAGLVDETGRIRVELAGDVPGVHLVEVTAPGYDLARLLAVSTDRPLSPAAGQALARCATVVALWITREQAVTAVENKYRGDFLRDIFLDRAGNPDFVLEHAASFGWDLRGSSVVLSAQIDAQAPGEERASQTLRRHWQDRFAAAWRQVTATLAPGSPCADFSSEVVAVLPVADMARAEQLVGRVLHAVAGDKGGGRRSFSVGVSRLAPDITGLPEAYAHARRALEVGRRVHGRGSTTWFDELGLHRLLAMIPDSAELDAFVHDVLGDLAADTDEAKALRETLQVLLDTNFNVAEAARAQFFHYNTMRYRVGKLERMLGPVSTDPDLRLDVAVALKAREVIGH